jgi:hypothetical protein
MEDYLGSKVTHSRFELNPISNVAANIRDDRTDTRYGEEVGFSAWIKGVSANVRSQLRQPESEPPTLEAGVAGEKNPTASPGEI